MTRSPASVRRGLLVVLTVAALTGVIHSAKADVDAVSGSATSALVGGSPLAPTVSGSATEPTDGYGPVGSGQLPSGGCPGVGTVTPTPAGSGLSIGLQEACTRGGGVAGENHLGFAESSAGASDVVIEGTSVGVVRSECRADGNGAVGQATIVGTSGFPSNPLPNTTATITTAGSPPQTIPVLLNEQVVTNTPGTAAITVNAIHYNRLGIDIIIGQSVCRATGPDVNVTTTAPVTPTSYFITTTPTLVTQAQPAGGTTTPGTGVFDTATVTGVAGRPAPTGTVTFTRFFDPPGASPCSGPNPVTNTVSLTPVNPATNPPSSSASSPAAPAPGTPGTVRFVARYSGDTNYNPLANSPCDAPGESVAVAGAPTISTTASGPVPVGGQIRDAATLTGGSAPTGTITFSLFGPDNPTCAGTPIFTSTVPVNGNGTYTSAGFATGGTPAVAVGGGAGGVGVGVGGAATGGTGTGTGGAAALPSGATGTYRWVARYSGDANNAPAGPTPCDDPAEAVTVGPAPSRVTTQASASAFTGGTISDTATLAGAFNPTGTITFDLFGPDSATCAGTPAFTSTVAVNGNGSYPSAAFTATAPGIYRWVARYSGDANNAPAGPTPCDDPAEQVAVRPLPTIAVTKTAIPASMPEPGGTFVFEVAVTNTGSPTVTISGLTDDIYGDLVTRLTSTCAGAPGTVLAPGATYRCRFTGDFRGRAGDDQTDTVTARAVDAVGNVATAAANATVTLTEAPPAITVTKTAAPATLPEPGGESRFTVVVTNSGLRPVTVTSLTDDVYGDLNGRGSCAIGTTLPPAGVYTCAFTGSFFANAGGRQTDTVTATAVDGSGRTVSATATATVTIADVAPTITLDLLASPATRPEPGGLFGFDVLVTNRSFEPVTVTSLSDRLGGDLNGRGTCLTGAALAPNGGTYRCSFPTDFLGDAGASRTDSATAVVVDDDGSTASAADTATITITDVPPTIRVSATPSPAALPPPGGTFTIELTIVNDSNEAVTPAAVADGLTGATPTGAGTCVTGEPIAPNGGTFGCSFTVNFQGGPGANVVDSVVVAAVDNDGSSTTAVAPVTLSIVAPVVIPPTGTTAPTTTRPAPATTVTTAPTTTIPPTTVPPTTVPPTTLPPVTTTPTTLPPPVSSQVNVPASRPADLRLDTPSSPPGGQVTAVGTGCTPGERVNVEVAGTDVASTVAGADGAFSATFDLPSVDVGAVDVVAGCGPVVLSTPVDVALQTNVEQGTSNLVVLVFFVLALLALSRRGGAGVPEEENVEPGG